MSAASGMVKSAAMGRSEGIAYGTQISLDGDHADAAVLADPAAARAVLLALIAQVEPEAPHAAPAPLVDERTGGVSAALVHGETAGVLHTFPELRTVTLHLFSAHDLSLSTTTRMFLDAYGVGRFRSAVREFGSYPPRDPAELRRALEGERPYARLRVLPAPTVAL